MAKIENAKKPFAIFVLSLLLLSQPGVSALWAQTAVIAQETGAASSEAESSSAASNPQTPSVSDMRAMTSAMASTTAGGGNFTWQILCGEPGTNRSIACDDACRPCISDTYFFWRKFDLQKIGFYYTDGSGHRQLLPPFSTGGNICRDGVSAINGGGTVPTGITPQGLYTEWNAYGHVYTLYSDTHAAIVCPRGGDRTDYYWDDQGNPGTHNDGHVIINYTPAPSSQCSDGIDNDGDGAADFPNDYSCSTTTDNDETNPRSQCQDGVDNDGNGYTDYPSDAGCSSQQDNTESGGQQQYQCNDGIDNDGDGAADYPNDFSCSSATDNDETNPRSQCQDGVDNDGDGVTDGLDPGCSGNQDNDERNICPVGTSTSTCRCATNADCTAPNTCQSGYCRPVSSQCSDGIDNDGDGATDYPADFSCSSATDTDETNPRAQCQDGSDNDHDGLSDYPNDPGCNSAQDNDETNVGTPSCTQPVSASVSFNSFNAPWNYGTSCAQPPVAVATNLHAGDVVRLTGTTGGVCGREYPRAGSCVSDTSGSIFGDCDDEGTQMYSCTDNTYSKAGFYDASHNLIAEHNISAFNASVTVPAGATALYVYFKEYNQTYYYDNNGGFRCNLNFSITGNCPAQCNDGLDNDGDGAADYPNDFSCSSATDTDETNPKAQCQDGIDNDGDGRIDANDLGCTDFQDNDEFNASSSSSSSSSVPGTAQCNDGIDNDGDGKIDALVELSPSNGQSRVWYADMVGIRTFYNQIAAQRGLQQISTDWNGQGMVSNDATTADKICELAGFNNVVSRNCFEYGTTGRCNFTSCSNNTMGVWGGSNMNIVNACGYTWLASLTCRDRLAACSDGIDNDGDGRIDMADTGCATVNDNSEIMHDPDCTGPTDNTESSITQCNDGIDNDGDGAADYPNDFSCTSPTDTDETNPKSQCQDGIDNDGDGLSDYPSDPGCSSRQDNDERNICPAATQTSNCRCATNADCTNPDTCQSGICRPVSYQCNDGIDNDQDGATDFPNDFSCTTATDNDETNPKAQCQDGVDNDGDGRVDYPNDLGCSSRQDNTEAGEAQCQDGIDNDGDGAADYPNDFSCTTPTDTDETNPKAQCQDGIDNDGDGLTDYPNDPGCSSRQDNDEHNICPVATQTSTCRCATNADCTNPDTCQSGICRPVTYQCNDGIDNDGDGATDYPADFSCSGPTDNDETNPKAQCQDGIDNDGDGRVDYQNDPGCSSRQDNNEGDEPQCQNGIDDDQDGATDYPADFSCSGPTDNDETNPRAQCQDGIDNDGDSLVDYPADPGCSTRQDNDEHNICPVATQTSTCHCSTNADCTVPDTCQSGICRPQGADLSVSKTGPTTVVAGTIVSYTVTATNAGPATATNVVIADVIPSGLTFNAGQSTAGCVLNGNGTSVLCNNFSLTAGQSRTFTIVFNVPSTQACGGNAVIQNVATVSSSSQDPNTANNTSQTVTTGVSCPTPQADLSIQKSGPSSVLRGDAVTYTITATNAGPSTATNVVVTDVIPSGLTFNAAGSSASCILNGAGTSVLCNNFNLNAGESRTFSLVFTASSSMSCGATIRNTADVSSSSVDPVSANNHSNEVSTSVTCPQADVMIVKSGPQSVNRGGNILYTVTVTNLGPQRSDNVVVVDRPESMAGLTFSASQSDTDCVLNGTEVLCNNISLQAGQSRTYNIVFTVSPTFTCGSTVANRANANVSTPDPHGDNNWSDRIVTTINCTQCNDGIDNDQDGATDYPADYSCSDANDNDETLPRAQCQDGVDNDGDQLVDYPNDPGCSNNQDNDESNIVLNPDASIQKSGPTTVIRGNTVSYTLTATNVGSATAQNVVVSDSIPSGLTFQAGASSPECVLNGGGTSVLCNNFSLAVGQTRTFTVTFTVTTAVACGATIQNTATVSTSNDVNTANNSSQWNTAVQCVTPQCSDGIDNDGDGATDYPNDYSCASPTDDDESNPRAQCQDGIDNDQDGAIDYPADIGCTSAQDNDESNPATPDLSITKTGPQTVNRGDTVSYTVTVTNIGTATALNVVVADVIPAGLTFHGGLSSTDCLLNGAGTSVLCNNFSLAAGQTKTFTITFNVPTTTVTCGSTIRNTATVSTSNDQNGSNNTSQTVSTSVQCPVQSADLGISKTSNVSSVLSGDPVTYTLNVTNSGPQSAANVVISDSLPAGVSFDVLFLQTNGFSCYRQSSDANHLVCVRPAMAVGETVTIRYQVRVLNQGTCTPRSLTNTAGVTALSGTDPNAGNNYAQATVQMTCPNLQSDLSIQKSVSPSSVLPGQPLTYTLFVQNFGPGTAQNVIVSDSLPSGLPITVQFLQSDGFSCWRQNSDPNHLVCTRSSMPAGATATIRFTATVSGNSCTPQTVLNTAAVNALNSTDPNAGNNATQVTAQLTCQNPVFTISKTDNRDTTHPGDILTYSITVTNTSDVNGTNVTVTDLLPGSVTFLTASDFGWSSGGSVTWQNLSIPAHTTKTLTVTVQVQYGTANGTVLTNNATVAGITAQDQTTVQSVTTADLSIMKTGPQLAQRGSTIFYTITVFNAGPGSSQNATVTDVVPGGLVFLPQQSTPQCALNGGTVTCSGISLAAGQSQSLTLAFEIPSSVTCGTFLLNAAEVHGINDPNCVNDLSQTVTTAVQCLSPTFTMSKTDGHTTAQPGDTLTYTVSVTNTSTVNATNITVTDTLPSLVTFQSASDGGTQAAGVLTWSGLSIAAGATKQLTVQVQVSQAATNGAIITNYASVAGVLAQDSTTVQVPQTNADVSVMKTGPQTAQQGSIALFAVTVFNAGPSAATNVVIGDVIPSGFTFNQAQTSSGCVLNGAGTSVLCNNFSLTNGQSRSFTIAFNVTQNATCNGVVQNTATVSTSNDTNPANNVSQPVSTTVQCPSPTFTITKTDNQTTVQPGGVLTYVVSVTNTSQIAATNVTVTDTLPSLVTFQSASDGGTQAAGVVTWSGLSIAAGATKTLTVQVQVSSAASNGTVLTNNAAVSGVLTSDTTTVQTQTPTFTISKTDNQTVVLPGATLSYTISVTNTSAVNATNVTVTDALPGLVTFLSASDGGTQASGVVTWNGLSIAAGATKVLTVQAQVSSSATNGTVLTNTATVAGVSAQDTTTVQTGATGADLSITKTGPSTVQQGGVVLYNVTVSNAGPSAATNVVIADVLPSGLTFNQAQTSSGCVLNGGGTSVLCNNFSLAAGQNRSFTIAFTVTQTAACNASIQNTATVSTSNDQNGLNNTSQTVNTTVLCPEATYTISKTDNRTTVLPGESLTYQITLTNTSSFTATNIQVTDALPSGVTYVTSSDGGTLNGATVRWTLGSLAAGASRTLIVIVTVPSTASNGTVLTNIALVGAATAQDVTTVNTGSSSSSSSTSSSSSSSSSECNLTVTLRDSQDPVDSDESFTYTIEVRNNNSTTVNNVALTQTLDSNVDFLSTTGGGNDDAGNTIRWTGLSIGGNSTSTFTTSVRVRGDRDGATIRSNAFACSAQDSENTQVSGNDIPPPPPPPPNGATLTVDKQADRTEAQAGSIIAYTISVRNQSNVAVGPVTIEDTFSASDMTVEYADGGSVNGGSIRWDLGTLGANATRLIHYRVRLSQSLQHGQTVSNTVQVLGGNATDTAQVQIIRYFPQTGLLTRFTQLGTDKAAFLQPVSPKKRNATDASIPALTWMILLSTGLTGGGLLGRKFLIGF
ncbi:MAG: hypothetical protein Q7S29_01245 [Candidatus Peribacter sp.]|nr:hypothetical protein [Candidatus Peribacter sp.]